MNHVKGLIHDGQAVSCFFRSSVEEPYRKALLQITERCNLSCAHCFVSAGNYGEEMSLAVIQETVVPRLLECRVTRVTLTGGEPFAHRDLMGIVRCLRKAAIEIGMCTNATMILPEQMEELAALGGIHINVSLDGFRPESHGKFRGNVGSFATTIKTIRQLAEHRLLQGLLVTPNNLAEAEEYAALCDFARQNGATYVLMNPLSNFGRGVKSKLRLATSVETMQRIRMMTEPFQQQMELTYIRFPNEKKLPLASCDAGHIIYVFVHGELTVCPYLVFAARTPQSQHRPEEFIVGNILHDADIAERLDAYKFHQRYQLGNNSTCNACSLNSTCGKGCPAAIIASGQRIEGVDRDLCPTISPLSTAGVGQQIERREREMASSALALSGVE